MKRELKLNTRETGDMYRHIIILCKIGSVKSHLKSLIGEIHQSKASAILDFTGTFIKVAT